MVVLQDGDVQQVEHKVPEEHCVVGVMQVDW